MKHPFIAWFFCWRDGHRWMERSQPLDDNDEIVEWVNPYMCEVCGKVCADPEVVFGR